MNKKHALNTAYLVSLITLETILCITAQENPDRIKQAINLLKGEKGTQTQQGVIYKKDVDPCCGDTKARVQYVEINDTVSAMQVSTVKIGKKNFIEALYLLDYKDGKPDGIPDKFTLAKIPLDNALKIMMENQDIKKYVESIGEPSEEMNKKYGSAIENLFK